jgi:hypothetical protein
MLMDILAPATDGFATLSHLIGLLDWTACA